MKKINGYYVDENNNKWNSSEYTEEQAIILSKTMVKCYDCSDCSDCSNCSRCSDCSSCSYCSDCSSCSYCSKCSYCSNCSNCSNCSDCSSCSYCSDCSSCSYCSKCSYCSDCSSCSSCSKCSDCSYCSDCSKCSYCSNCSNCSDCSCCSKCSNYKTNPNRYTGNAIGSRNDKTTTYWIGDNIQIICGCWKGTLEEFEKRVKETYKSKKNKYRKQYDNYIAIVKNIINKERK